MVEEAPARISVGNCLHKTSVLADITFLLSPLALPRSFSRSISLPAGVLSVASCTLYGISWQFGPCGKYQDTPVEEADTLDDVSSIEDEEWIPSEIPDWEEPVDIMTVVTKYASPTVSSEEEVDRLEKEEKEPLPDTTRPSTSAWQPGP